ncbi:MAG TPA: prepilin peptidase [Patescibacteria group bacterium]|nr:prepilin peptidase [Patescibacteria group bacterium]
MFEYFAVIVFGLIIGSFLTALSFRIPKKISIAKGRSFCDICKKKIAWYDNIPLLSYLLLKGKCRNCHKKISLRYPLIELSTTLTFLVIYIIYTLYITSFIDSVFYAWGNALGVITLPYFIFISIILITIFIIDLEKGIIPDNLIFILYLTVSIFLVLTHMENFYLHFFAGMLSSLLLYFLFFITKGRGMGLGDVKLAIPLGTILGLTISLVWIFLAFLTGAYIGIILILIKRAKLKDKLAFGPFLIFAFFAALIWGNRILVNLNIF